MEIKLKGEQEQELLDNITSNFNSQFVRSSVKINILGTVCLLSSKVSQPNI